MTPAGRSLPNETLIRTGDDATFGALELWHWRSGSGPLMVEWRGAVTLDDGSNVAVIINIERQGLEDATLGYLGEAVREAFSALTQNAEGVRLSAASEMLATAQDWSKSAGRPPPTLTSFAASLEIKEFAIDADVEGANITVWFEDTGDFFAGHGLYASYDETGVQLDVALFG